MVRLELNVTGMSCSHCEKAVTNAMDDIGVKVIKASAQGGIVELEYDPAKVTPEDIKVEITDAGYKVQ